MNVELEPGFQSNAQKRDDGELSRAIVILNFVRRFRNFIADTVPW